MFAFIPRAANLPSFLGPTGRRPMGHPDCFPFQRPGPAPGFWGFPAFTGARAEVGPFPRTMERPNGHVSKRAWANLAGPIPGVGPLLFFKSAMHGPKPRAALPRVHRAPGQRVKTRGRFPLLRAKTVRRPRMIRSAVPTPRPPILFRNCPPRLHPQRLELGPPPFALTFPPIPGRKTPGRNPAPGRNLTGLPRER